MGKGRRLNFGALLKDGKNSERVDELDHDGGGSDAEASSSKLGPLGRADRGYERAQQAIRHPGAPERQDREAEVQTEGQQLHPRGLGQRGEGEPPGLAHPPLKQQPREARAGDHNHQLSHG